MRTIIIKTINLGTICAPACKCHLESHYIRIGNIASDTIYAYINYKDIFEIYCTSFLEVTRLWRRD